jgi:hypothetical protein
MGMDGLTVQRLFPRPLDWLFPTCPWWRHKRPDSSTVHPRVA